MNQEEQVYKPILHCLNKRALYLKTTQDWEWVIGDPVVSNFKLALYFMCQTGTIHLTHDLKARAHFKYLQTSGYWLKLVTHLKPILALIDQAGIDIVPLKGADLIHTIYPKIGMRRSVDFDLLVRPEHLLTTAEILIRAGMEPNWAAVEGDFFYFKKVPQPRWPTAMSFSDQQGFTIDLHHHLVNYPWFQPAFPVEMDDVWRRCVQNTYANETPWKLRLSPYDRLAHLCLHLAIDGLYVIKNFFDVDQVLRNLPDDWDWQCYLDLAGAWQIKSVSFHVFNFCQDFFETPIPNQVLKALAPHFVAQWQVRALISPKAVLTGRKSGAFNFRNLIIFSLFDGTRAKLNFLKSLFFPDKNWLLSYHNYDTLIEHWRSLFKLFIEKLS